MVAVLHDLETVRRVFPETLLIAREPVAWGDDGGGAEPENLLKARRMIEAFDPHAQSASGSAPSPPSAGEGGLPKAGREGGRTG